MCSAGPRHSTGRGGGCTEIKFQTVEGDFGIRHVSKAKSILHGFVYPFWLDLGLTQTFILTCVPSIQIQFEHNELWSINKREECPFLVEGNVKKELASGARG